MYSLKSLLASREEFYDTDLCLLLLALRADVIFTFSTFSFFTFNGSFAYTLVSISNFFLSEIGGRKFSATLFCQYASIRSRLIC
jgi:hypothetical protein